MTPEIVWILAALLMLAGVAGSVLPALPGAPLILVAAVLHRWLLPGWVSLWTIAALAVLAALTVVVDAACGVFGVQRFGGGRWAMLGAGVGAAVGLFFGPLGLLFGGVAGAVICEMLFDRKALNDALKAGVGAGLGMLVGTILRLGLALFMAAWLVADFLIN
ncbi:MAG: DUF456 domain-containing protein [Elusimicrobia bacterium]|nr:DUF456 domain-containing protein [Elusimicrobiota bacterium]